jgi:hypothetical protein
MPQLVLITQWCGPSKLVLTFEDEGQGRFSPKEIENMAVRDKRGNVVRLNLPQKAVVISNHQVSTILPSHATVLTRYRYMQTGGMLGGVYLVHFVVQV